MHAAHGALVALGHGQEHWGDLIPPGLAHEDPVGVHAKAVSDEVGGGDGALAFDVDLPDLEGYHVGVQIGVAVEAQLQGVLDGHQPLAGRNLVA